MNSISPAETALFHYTVSVLLTSFLYVGSVAAQETTANLVREVAVTSSARSWVPANEAIVTLSVESVGSKADEQLLSNRQTVVEIEKAIRVIEPSVVVLNRGSKIENAGNAKSSLSNGNSFRASYFLGFQTKNLESLGKIIDASISSGAKEVVEVEYLSPIDEESHLQAVMEATKKAQTKAERVAASLGVTLGKILSSTISEEPVGGMLRKRMQAGVLAGPYNEYNTTIYVNARFEVEN